MALTNPQIVILCSVIVVTGSYSAEVLPKKALNAPLLRNNTPSSIDSRFFGLGELLQNLFRPGQGSNSGRPGGEPSHPGFNQGYPQMGGGTFNQNQVVYPSEQYPYQQYPPKQGFVFYPQQSQYPSQGNFPNQNTGGIPNQGINQFPNQGGLMNQGPSGFPYQRPGGTSNQGAFPNEGGVQFPVDQGVNQFPNQEINQFPNQFPNQSPDQGQTAGGGTLDDIIGEGGFQQPEQEGFQTPDQEGFQNSDQGNFQQPDQGSFQRPDQGSFQRPDQGSFQRPDQSSFQRPDQGSFQRPDQGDFQADGGDFSGSASDQFNEPGAEPAAIPGIPVIVPPTTTPAGQILFNNRTESASERQCVQDCPTTTEYNPICGSNGVTYFNPGRFKCARDCGINVFVVRRGTCN